MTSIKKHSNRKKKEIWRKTDRKSSERAMHAEVSNKTKIKKINTTAQQKLLR